MTKLGLWGQAKVEQVVRNIKAGRIHMESTVVHDTTHYPAYSSMQTVEVPPPAPQTVNPPAASTGPAAPAQGAPSADAPQHASKKGKKAGKGKKAEKPRRKSHPKTTKACRCQDREHCPHPWINADEGTGTVVKSTSARPRTPKALPFAKPARYVPSATAVRRAHARSRCPSSGCRGSIRSSPSFPNDSLAPWPIARPSNACTS